MIKEYAEEFTCWRCEGSFSTDEAYPFGMELVCEGCSE